jgi:hypothetical protein
MFVGLRADLWCWNRRVLNDLYRARLSCGRIIRPLAHPLPPLSCQQVVSLSLSSCVSPVELADGRGGWTWNQIIRPWESLASIHHSILFGFISCISCTVTVERISDEEQTPLWFLKSSIGYQLSFKERKRVFNSFPYWERKAKNPCLVA